MSSGIVKTIRRSSGGSMVAYGDRSLLTLFGRCAETLNAVPF
jgi:hypothetical protein